MLVRDFVSFLFTGQPFSDRELAQVRGEISFSEAISAHLEWKRRFAAALADGGENMPVCEHVSTDSLCELGKWINGMGRKRYGELKNFIDLREEHIRFHRVAGEVVTLCRGSRSDEAKALLNGEFRRSSNEIVSRLRHFSTLFGS